MCVCVCVCYLSFGQGELSCKLSPFSAHNVLAPLELHFQPVQLFGCEGGSGAFGSVQVQTLWQNNLSDRAFGIWSQNTHHTNTDQQMFSFSSSQYYNCLCQLQLYELLALYLLLLDLYQNSVQWQSSRI